ncbi:MAG: EAL domain-containing protein [Desulfuromonadales bacterium]|nr:EAL domain-containing protein [Desulfuromonadales bacterium]
MKITFIKRYLFIVGLAWTAICVAVLYSHLEEDYKQSVAQAQTRARTMLERDILYRDWVAGHGGVYVPITEEAQPNPHLNFLPERDIEATDGRRFTLVNPSYMTHQAFEIDNRLGNTVSKLTSLNYLNPGNAPDAWERAALVRLAKGENLVSEVVKIKDQPVVRTIRPFYIEAECLKCHARQGYHLGDVRGGLSITVPFESFLSGHWKHNLLSVLLFVLLWLSGMAGVFLLGRKLYTQTHQVIESDRQRDQAEMSLDFMSNYDRRTNLPNRFKFEELLFDLFKKADVSGSAVAVTTVEVRNYKQIIDNFDHPVGDALFKMIAERLAAIISPNDSVARFGEDRLLFSSMTSSEETFTEDTLLKIWDGVSKPLFLEGHQFFPVISMGTALYPQDAADAKRVVQRSVSALTYCLEEKVSGVALFSRSIHDQAKTRLKIETGLRSALNDNNLELYLQPQVDSKGALVGAEALLRWKRDGEEYIPPVEFIPVAEESGLILPIGEWVLQTAAVHALRLREKFGRVIPVGVNVSARQFQDSSFIDIVDEILSIDGVSAEMLEIEITESTFIEDIDKTIEILTDLKVRGLQIAIDDFGTGYSSLSYLNRFPIDRLKIDMSFVADIATSEDDRVLISLIAEMGRKLGLKVIAEGVEDEIQKHLLIGMGCDALQGFLFGRPVPFDDFCTYVEQLRAD